MYVMPLHRKNIGTKKALYRFGKETAYEMCPDDGATVRSIPRDPENYFSRTHRRQVSRLAAYDAVAFPIAQWLLLA